MRYNALARFLVVLVVAVAVEPARAQLRGDGPPPEAPAQDRDARLEALLQRLQAATGEAEAEQVARDVRRLWMQSDDQQAADALEEAVIFVSQGLLKPALDVLDDVVVRAPRFAEAWFRRASVHYVMNQPARARADLDRAIELEPRHFVALMTRGQLFLEQRQWKSALGDFRAALRVHPFLKEPRRILPELERLAGDRGI